MTKSIHYGAGRDVQLEAFGVVRPTPVDSRESLALSNGLDRLAGIAGQQADQQMVAEYAQMGAEAGLKRDENGNIAPLELYKPDTSAGRAFNANAINSYASTILLDAEKFSKETVSRIQTERETNPDGTVGPRKAADMVDAWDKTWTPYVEKTLGRLPDAVRAQVQGKLALSGSQYRAGLTEKQAGEAVEQTIDTATMATNNSFREALGYARAGNDELAQASIRSAEQSIRMAQQSGGAFDFPSAMAKLELVKQDLVVEKEWRAVEPVYAGRVKGPNTQINAAIATKAEIKAQSYPKPVEDILLARLNDKASDDIRLDGEKLARAEQAAVPVLGSLTRRVTEAINTGKDPSGIFEEARRSLDIRIADRFEAGFASSLGAPRTSDEQNLNITNEKLFIQLGAQGIGDIPSQEAIERRYLKGDYGVPGSPAAQSQRQSLMLEAATAQLNLMRPDPDKVRATQIARNLEAGLPVTPEDKKFMFKTQEDNGVTSIREMGTRVSRAVTLDPSSLNILDPRYRASILEQAKQGVLTERAEAQILTLIQPSFAGTPAEIKQVVDIGATVLKRMETNPEFKTNMTIGQQVSMRTAISEYQAIFSSPEFADQSKPEVQGRLRQALDGVRDRMVRKEPEDPEVRNASLNESFDKMTSFSIPRTTGGIAGIGATDLSAAGRAREAVRLFATTDDGKTMPNKLYTNAGLQFAGLEQPGFVGPMRILEGALSAVGGYTEVMAATLGIEPKGPGGFVMKFVSKPLDVSPAEQQKLAPEVSSLLLKGATEDDVKRFVRNGLHADQFNRRNAVDNTKVHMTSDNSVTRTLGDAGAANLVMSAFLEDQAAKFGGAIAAGAENAGAFVNLPKSIPQMIRDGDIRASEVPAGRGGSLPVANGVAQFEVFYKSKNGSWMPMPDRLVVPVMPEHAYLSAGKSADAGVAQMQIEQREADAARGTEQTPLHAPFWGAARIAARASAITSVAVSRLREAYADAQAPSYIGRLERKP